MPTKRRDAGRPRGKPIEEAILVAALDDLAVHGLEGVSIPRIARVAEVNKTTIYRRWATREALISAALQSTLAQSRPLEDTGTLRGDLMAMLQMLATRLQSPAGRALARVALSDAAAEVFASLSGEPLRQELEAGAALVQRAVERGEWDVEAHPPDAVLAMLAGGVMHRVMVERRPVTDAWMQTVVNIAVAGIFSGPAEHQVGS